MIDWKSYQSIRGGQTMCIVVGHSTFFCPWRATYRITPAGKYLLEDIHYWDGDRDWVQRFGIAGPVLGGLAVVTYFPFRPPDVRTEIPIWPVARSECCGGATTKEE